MHNLKLMQKCAFMNFCNWLLTPKIWIILGVMFTFSIWNLSNVVELSISTGIRVSPWILPHYFAMPAMRLFYGFLTIALFADAPFRNSLSQFVEIRTGKSLWIQGQCLFIIEASFFYTILYFFMTILIILPRIYVTMRWGKLIETIAYNTEMGMQLPGIGFSSQLIETYSPIEATIVTAFFIWLLSCLIGMLILIVNIIINKNAGSVIAGFIVFLSYFSIYVGSMIFGNKIHWIACVNWIYIGMTAKKSGGSFPDRFYIVSFLLLGIIGCYLLGTKAYKIKNID